MKTFQMARTAILTLVIVVAALPAVHAHDDPVLGPDLTSTTGIKVTNLTFSTLFSGDLR